MSFTVYDENGHAHVWMMPLYSYPQDRVSAILGITASSFSKRWTRICSANRYTLVGLVVNGRSLKEERKRDSNWPYIDRRIARKLIQSRTKEIDPFDTDGLRAITEECVAMLNYIIATEQHVFVKLGQPLRTR